MRNTLYGIIMRHVTGVLTPGKPAPGYSVPPGTSHGNTSPRACTPFLRPITTLIYPITQRTTSIAIAESIAHYINHCHGREYSKSYATAMPEAFNCLA